MHKTLCSLAVMTTLCGTAYAQSNVTIYGLIDTGLVKETGSDLKMSQWTSSRLGRRVQCRAVRSLRFRPARTSQRTGNRKFPPT